MVIAFVIFAVLGILIGIFAFFLGLSIFSNYINSAKSLDENVGGDGEVADADTVGTENQQKTELTDEQMDLVKKKESIFTPLPMLLGIEGACLFVFNIVMLVLKFVRPKFLEFYILLAINVGIILVSFVVDGIVMSKYANSDENQANDVDDMGENVK